MGLEKRDDGADDGSGHMRQTAWHDSELALGEGYAPPVRINAEQAVLNEKELVLGDVAVANNEPLA